MDKIKVMVNGLPGRMAAVVARHVMAGDAFELVPHSLTGPEITQPSCVVEATTVALITPDRRDTAMEAVIAACGPFISVDYTHPSAVNANAAYYCRQGLPFVMGTTGGDRQALAQAVTASASAAVIAPNMAKQIVGFQAMMAYAAQNFPGLFNGYSLDVRESHQKGKADTSGTAKAVVGYFNALGIPFDENRIQMERDPQRQQHVWGIAPDHLAGHGWHTYALTSADGSVHFEFTHNVNGREIYAMGTLDAVMFLHAKVNQGARGQVFSMIDVLTGSGPLS
jgi:4-hydroxy-tetrahydrodipicolinate reductase